MSADNPLWFRLLHRGRMVPSIPTLSDTIYDSFSPTSTRVRHRLGAQLQSAVPGILFPTPATMHHRLAPQESCRTLPRSAMNRHSSKALLGCGIFRSSSFGLHSAGRDCDSRYRQASDGRTDEGIAGLTVRPIHPERALDASWCRARTEWPLLGREHTSASRRLERRNSCQARCCAYRKQEKFLVCVQVRRSSCPPSARVRHHHLPARFKRLTALSLYSTNPR